jgi:S1-C subfamily serine protease
MPNSPAQKAGLKPYDVVVAFDGQEIKTALDLSLAVKRAQSGRTYPVEVIRDNSKKTFSVVLSEKKAGDDTVTDTTGTSDKANKTGLYLEKTSEGLVVKKIDDDSAAAMAGVETGDVVLEVNRQKITDVSSFYKHYKEKGMNMLRLKRGDATIIIAFNS